MLRVTKTFVKPTLLRSLCATSSAIRLYSSCLIDEPEYGWLKELGLKNVNNGVFDGEWKTGQGPVSTGI